MMVIHDLLQQHGDDPLALLKALGGYYECAKDASGKRLGPLVGYAGTYEPGKHYVGDVYANIAMAEQYPIVLHHWASRLLGRDKQDPTHLTIDGFCGAPEGGKAIADKLALLTAKRYMYPEKKVITPATGGQREKTSLIFGRHGVHIRERIAIVEDISNNFSTTAQLVELIEQAGGIVVAIISILNRSPDGITVFTPKSGGSIPVNSLVRRPFPEYRQEDPEVAADIARGNIVWKPKDTWDEFAHLSA